ncbi:MAG: staygreen family protein [Candidatus Thorarchaeota archaeon]
MRRLNPDKLHVRFIPPTNEDGPLHPRAYTLTHSDRTGELYLTIGPDYDRKQIRGWYTRLMRDEVLSEWKKDIEGPQLHVYCEVGRGFGSSSFRESIFRRELDLVLESLRYGDRRMFEGAADLDNARIKVHFIARKSEDSKMEDWGMMKDYA